MALSKKLLIAIGLVLAGGWLIFGFLMKYLDKWTGEWSITIATILFIGFFIFLEKRGFIRI